VADATATVRVETSFAGHAFTVKLARQGQAWQIADVVCAGER
jgi:hypothetical protein